MYGPTFNIELNKDTEYDIPNGYASDKGYIYYKAKYVGELEQYGSHWIKDKYLVFKSAKEDNKHYVLCIPDIRVWSNNLQITFDPKAWGDTLEKALEELNAKYRWKWHAAEINSEYPDLGEFKKE